MLEDRGLSLECSPCSCVCLRERECLQRCFICDVHDCSKSVAIQAFEELLKSHKEHLGCARFSTPLRMTIARSLFSICTRVVNSQLLTLCSLCCEYHIISHMHVRSEESADNVNSANDQAVQVQVPAVTTRCIVT